MDHSPAPIPEQEIIEKFLNICHKNLYPPRTNIIVPGDLADALYFVMEGSLTISMTGEDNRDYILAYLSPGDYIGEMGLFVPAHQREVSIQTRTHCTLAKIPYTRLWAALENELEGYAVQFLRMVGEKLSTRLLKSNRKVLTLSSLDVQGRIARTLIELCQEPGSKSDPRGTRLKITREEMSRLVGCSREVASRTLKNLEEQGMIVTEGRDIIVLATEESTSSTGRDTPSLL